MFKQGDRVVVQGFLQKWAILRVWRVGDKGIWCCTEDGYKRKLAGEDAPTVGYPTSDVRGLSGEITHAEDTIRAQE